MIKQRPGLTVLQARAFDVVASLSRVGFHIFSTPGFSLRIP